MPSPGICADVDSVTSDVLGMMMTARDTQTGEGMTDDELRDQVVTLMLAGHEASSTLRQTHIDRWTQT